MATKSLKGRQKALAETNRQLEILGGGPFETGDLPYFRDKLAESGQAPLRPRKLEILQINLGYMCNQVCEHCHVDAGPDRKEIMTRETMELCLEVIRKTGAHTLDLTGGAPEMNPDFRWFVEQASKAGVSDFIVRSNLTIIRANKKYHDLPEFFARHNVHVVSSLPHYTRGKTDKQRGDGVFDKSIEALRALNAVGYGMPGSPLKLDLVYNPSGAFLPADQESLERDFKKALKEQKGENQEEWKKDIDKASLLIKCIQQRNNTMRQLMERLVAIQKSFIIHGDTQLESLTRAQIADELDVHESTISRAVANKTVQLPNKKIIPMATFFDRSLAVRAIMRNIIESENHAMNDTEIRKSLEQQGIRVARRTVAKYRAMEGILPAHLRRIEKFATA